VIIWIFTSIHRYDSQPDTTGSRLGPMYVTAPAKKAADYEAQYDHDDFMETQGPMEDSELPRHVNDSP